MAVGIEGLELVVVFTVGPANGGAPTVLQFGQLFFPSAFTCPYASNLTKLQALAVFTVEPGVTLAVLKTAPIPVEAVVEMTGGQLDLRVGRQHSDHGRGAGATGHVEHLAHRLGEPDELCSRKTVLPSVQLSRNLRQEPTNRETETRMRTSIRLFCWVAGLSLVGCTLSRPLAYHAVSYNKIVEIAQNRMLLLNVVRASKRHPMYFTGIGSITAAPSYAISSGKATLTNTIATAFKATTEKTDTDADSLELPSASFSNKPTLQIGVLDTQDFIRGILSPVCVETVSHYLRQGWRSEILASLLIERIETTSPEKLGLPSSNTKMVIVNDPGKDFKDFQTIMNFLSDYRCDLKNRGERKPLVVLGKEPSLGDVVKAIGSSLGLDQEKGEVTVSRKEDSWAILCSLKEPSTPETREILAYIGDRDLEDARSHEKTKGADAELNVAFILRSPHAGTGADDSGSTRTRETGPAGKSSPGRARRLVRQRSRPGSDCHRGLRRSRPRAR